MASLLATAPASAVVPFSLFSLNFLRASEQIKHIENNHKNRLAGLTALNGIVMAGYIARDGYKNNISRSESRGKISRACDGIVAVLNPKNYGRKLLKINRVFSPEALKSPDMLQPKFSARAKEFWSTDPLLALTATLFVANLGYSAVQGGKYLLAPANSKPPANPVKKAPSDISSNASSATQTQGNSPAVTAEVPATQALSPVRPPVRPIDADEYALTIIPRSGVTTHELPHQGSVAISTDEKQAKQIVYPEFHSDAVVEETTAFAVSAPMTPANTVPPLPTSSALDRNKAAANQPSSPVLLAAFHDAVAGEVTHTHMSPPTSNAATSSKPVRRRTSRNATPRTTSPEPTGVPLSRGVLLGARPVTKPDHHNLRVGKQTPRPRGVQAPDSD